jgi:hypothetical protein
MKTYKKQYPETNDFEIFEDNVVIFAEFFWRVIEALKGRWSGQVVSLTRRRTRMECVLVRTVC